MDFHDATEFAGLNGLDDALGAGEEWEFGAAADEAAGFGGGVVDFGRGGEVDAEGFFGEEVFAGVEDVEVEFFVEVVGDGDIDDIDFGGAEEFGVVLGEELDGGDLAEPIEEFVLEIADGGEFSVDGEVMEGEPASKGGGGFAAHEASADDADAHFLFCHRWD